MLNVVWMLFVAWFLSLFGFDEMFIEGLHQFGGPEITLTGYYFIFSVIGIIKNVVEKLNFNSSLKLALNEIEDILEE